MKISKQLLISFVLMLSACRTAPAKIPAEATTAPEATPTVLQTPPKVVTTPTIREQSDKSGERVEFEPGISAATRSGALIDGGSKEYVLSGAAGQAMNIETVGYNAPVNFTLTSPTGETWSGESHASEVHIFRAQMVLSQDGDYVVRLTVPSGDTRYDVTFTIVGGWLPAKQPERVEFAPGTSSIEYSSILPSGLSIKQYVLEAKEGQIMTVNFVSADVPISLSITSPNGMLLFSEILQTNGSSSGGNVHNLAETGDYVITLTKGDHTPSTHYTLDFTIQ